MKTNTQEDKVKYILKTYGVINNFWAIENKILRLGAIIKNLRDDGINIEGVWGEKINNYTPSQRKTNKKNFHYILTEYCKYNDDKTVTFTKR